MKLLLLYRKRYPTAFSIERLFDQLAAAFERKSVEVSKTELPHFNNTPTNVVKNGNWARSRVRGMVESKVKSAADATLPKIIKHVTGDVTSTLFWIKGPTVITIHDCNPLLRYPKTHPRYWFYRYFIYEWPAKRADAVTVISQKTKDELLELTNCSADNVHVIPNFVDPAFIPLPRPFNTKCPTILQVGVKENKNIGRLAQALRGISCKLEIIGEPTPADTAILKENKIDFHFSSGITDDELRQRYAECDLLSFVSTYEGFGLPILEAQVTRRPVITSNISPHKEVAGEGGAVLVDPLQVEDIRSGILRIINSSSDRDQLLERGGANAARYGIDAIADRYLKLYESIL